MTTTSAEPNQWTQQNLDAINARLQPIRKLKDGAIYVEPSGIHFHVVTKTGSSVRFLLVEQTNPNSTVTQSEIDIDNPLQMMESYTQGQLLSLLWRPQPRAVYMAGFGGGRLAMALHHYYPHVQIDCTDIEPNIVNVAQRFFGIQLDDRLHVAIEDGREWLAKNAKLYDIILLDVFLDNGYSSYRMTTVEFFELCRSRLVPGGVIAINVLGDDPFLASKEQSLKAAFPAVYTYSEPGENVILIGTSNTELGLEELKVRAAQLDAIHAFPFPYREIGGKLVEGLGKFEDMAASSPLLTDADPPVNYFDNLPSFAAPFSRVAPDLPCPCGSGKRFGDCHGAET